MIDMSGFDPRIAETEVRVACDVDNPLTGSRGAAAVYGHQKGATTEMVRILDRNLKHYAEVIEAQLGLDVDVTAGAGAAGGLGAGLLAFCRARLESGSKLLADAVGLEDRLRDAQLCITGEGQIDRSSRSGKVCCHVADLAGRNNVPVIALVGTVGPEADATAPPLTAFFSIINRPMALPEAMSGTPALLEQLAEHVGRVFRAGQP